MINVPLFLKIIRIFNWRYNKYTFFYLNYKLLQIRNQGLYIIFYYEFCRCFHFYFQIKYLRDYIIKKMLTVSNQIFKRKMLINFQ